MKEGFTFNKVSLMFLRKVIFKNFGCGGGGNRKEPSPIANSSPQISFVSLQLLILTTPPPAPTVEENGKVFPNSICLIPIQSIED